jgi:hypothetical protein
MKKRRIMAKARVYGFSPWVDQVDAINQIMEETGERKESVLLRTLVDEALEARRKKSPSLPLIEKSDNDFGVRLQAIETLLMRLVGDGDVSFRIQDVCLALLQDGLAEAHATRRLVWEFAVMPKLRDDGIDENELERQFRDRRTQRKSMRVVSLNASGSHRKRRNRSWYSVLIVVSEERLGINACGRSGVADGKGMFRSDFFRVPIAEDEFFGIVPLPSLTSYLPNYNLRSLGP